MQISKPDGTFALRESLVRTSVSTAKTRAKREGQRIFVWYSMGAAAPLIGERGEECAWVRSEEEGPPRMGALDDERDPSAFVLCDFDQYGEVHFEPARFAWVRDTSGLGIPDEVMCGHCTDYCTLGRVVVYVRRLREVEYDADWTCTRCGRPLHMPGL